MAIQNKEHIFPASPAAKYGHVIKLKPMRCEQIRYMHLTRKGWFMASYYLFTIPWSMVWTMQMRVTPMISKQSDAKCLAS